MSDPFFLITTQFRVGADPSQHDAAIDAIMASLGGEQIHCGCRLDTRLRDVTHAFDGKPDQLILGMVRAKLHALPVKGTAEFEPVTNFAQTSNGIVRVEGVLA